MPRYAQSEEALRHKILLADEKKKYDTERAELRKRRELMRRKINATLYEPKMCMGDPVTAQVCSRFAIPGAGFCADHGGTTKAMQTAAKTRLLCLVEPALRALNKCLASGDLNIVLKASQVILDRAGFHPHATLEIQENPVDYSSLSAQQLRNRALKLVSALGESIPADGQSPDSPSSPLYEELDVIDAEEPVEDKVH